ncbi:MAG TPA: hypothetical protein VNN79_12155 [Actinomycetota bacterium]|nr:hypothetical protein [Actinomycetota bacterium]
MAWYNSLKDLGGDISSGAKAVGHTVGTIASNPIVDAGLGLAFGPGAAAAAKGIGTLLAPGGNIGKAALGAGEGYALGKGGQLLKNAFSAAAPAIDAGGGAAAGGGGAATAGAGAGGGGFMSDLGTLGHDVFGGGDGSILDDIKGVGGDIIGGAGKAVSSLGGGSALKGGLTLAAVLDAAQQRARQKDLQNKGLGFATDAYNANAPLRQLALAKLSNPNTGVQDLSSIYKDPYNPFAKTVPLPQFGAAASPTGA